MALSSGKVNVTRNFDYRKIQDEEEKQHIIVRLDDGKVVAGGKDKKLRVFSERGESSYQLDYTINLDD